MAMITDALLDAFTAAHKLGQHAPMTIHEEEQLVHSHRRRRELEAENAVLRDKAKWWDAFVGLSASDANRLLDSAVRDVPSDRVSSAQTCPNPGCGMSGIATCFICCPNCRTPLDSVNAGRVSE